MADPWKDFDPLRTPIVTEAPATEADPWAAFNPTPPAKGSQPKADDPWAAFNPTAPKKSPDVVTDVVKQVVSNIPRGMASTVDLAEMTSLPHAASRAARYLLFGDKRSRVEAMDEVFTPPKPETKAGEYGATVGETIGGSALPGLGWIGAARGIAANAVKAPATSALARLGQSMAKTTAENPVRAGVYDLLSATTSGIGQQAAKDAGAGQFGQTLAGIVFGGVPLLPSLARKPFQSMREYAAGQGERGAYKRFADQLPDDVDTFANQVATGPSRRNVETQRQTLDALGEEMDRVTRNPTPQMEEAAKVLAERRGIDIDEAKSIIARRDAVTATIDRLVKEQKITPGTAKDRLRNLTAVHADSPLLLAEYGAAAPSNAKIRSVKDVDNLDPRMLAHPANTGAHYLIDDLANSPGRAAFTTREAIETRNLGMKDVVRGKIEEMAPLDPISKERMTAQHVPERIEELRRIASQEYQQAYRAPTNFDLVKQELPQLIEKHQTIAAGRYGETHNKLMEGLSYISEAWRRGDIDTALQRMQDARAELRQLRDGANNPLTGRKTTTYDALDNLYDDVTDLMTRANPTWGSANSRWAGMNIAEEAKRLGETFAEKAGPKFRRDADAYSRLDPEVQDLVKTEWLAKTFEKLDNAGDTHDVAKFFKNDHIRNAIEMFFGREAMLDITKIVRDAAIATKSGRMLGNSSTHFRSQRQIVADAETGILPSMESTVKEGPKKAMMGQLWSVLSDRINKPLARIATTPMRDTAQVAMELHNMRKAQEFIERLRQQRSMPIIPTKIVTGIGAATTSDPATDRRR